MDFQSVNPLNVRLNMISGNLLPMTADDTSFSILWRVYSALMWLSQLVLVIALIPAFFYVPKEKSLKDGMPCMVIMMEMFFIFMRLHACRNEVGRIIQRINDILRASDNTMKNLVIMTAQPVQTPLTFYFFAGLIAVTVYVCLPLLLLLKKDLFWYQDYAYPVVLFGHQPFTSRTYILGNLVLMVSSVNIFLRKSAADVYMVHMILMITAQYRYIAVKITMILRDNEDIHSASRDTGSSKWKKAELKLLCRHHNTLLYMSLLLKKTLSSICCIIHINSILRFCFLCVMCCISFTSGRFWEGMTICMYLLGAMVQLYILCFCVQQLSDASTQLTDKAFHQEWYISGMWIKKIFMFLIVANNLGCNLATIGNFNLTLPAFITILNQAYSFALLFLRIR